MFKCANQVQCISKSFLCDGESGMIMIAIFIVHSKYVSMSYFDSIARL
jgi:hypothetical protein